jgi:hypothetical protein
MVFGRFRPSKYCFLAVDISGLVLMIFANGYVINAILKCVLRSRTSRAVSRGR